MFAELSTLIFCDVLVLPIGFTLHWTERFT